MKKHVYSVDLDLTGALARPTRCPHCLADDLQPAITAERVNFFCTNCRLCWHIDLGRWHGVNPETCERCPLWPQCTQRVPDPFPVPGVEPT